ncbi:DUF2514 family protein [Bordetella avium]|uniref:DUF2514 family protein n=1 Tax=Bordetella avium TaxID=521 RepID=UPI003B8364BE
MSSPTGPAHSLPAKLKNPFGPTNGGPPGAAGADLLAYMLGRVSDRAAELAAIADRARVAGLRCEWIYDGLSR